MNSFALARPTPRIPPPGRPTPDRPANVHGKDGKPLPLPADQMPTDPSPAKDRPSRHFLRV